GGVSVEDCRWLKPVKPGDVLRMDIEILETRAHPRRAVGFVKMRWDIFNQREQVASVATTPLLARRSATWLRSIGRILRSAHAASWAVVPSPKTKSSASRRSTIRTPFTSI